MHLYVLMRGIKGYQDMFITDLQGKYVPFEFPYDPNKKELQMGQVQIALRPIQLFEIAFPETYKDIMLATILGADGKTQHRKHDKFIWGIRKILGADPIPKYKTEQFFPTSKAHTEVVGIGIKKDDWIDCRDGKRYPNKANEFCFEGL